MTTIAPCVTPKEGSRVVWSYVVCQQLDKKRNATARVAFCFVGGPAGIEPASESH